MSKGDGNVEVSRTNRENLFDFGGGVVGEAELIKRERGEGLVKQ